MEPIRKSYSSAIVKYLLIILAVLWLTDITYIKSEYKTKEDLQTSIESALYLLSLLNGFTLFCELVESSSEITTKRLLHVITTINWLFIIALFFLFVSFSKYKIDAVESNSSDYFWQPPIICDIIFLTIILSQNKNE